MSALTRRRMIGLAASALLATAGSGALAQEGWIEVVGMAPEGPQARRQALGDAILSAALAGGAEVRGHSVLAQTRVTSDLLVVRPLGRVVAHQVIGDSVTGGIRRLTIRARVVPADQGPCGSGRRLDLTLYPAEIGVAPQAPAWAAALAQDIAAGLVLQAERHPAVAASRRMDRRPAAATSYATLVSGSRAVREGGHGLDIAIEIAPAGDDLVMVLRLALNGPAGEGRAEIHRSQVRHREANLTGRAAPPSLARRARLTEGLVAGAAPALDRLLGGAGCAPVLARATLQGNRLMVPAGRLHGLTRTSLAASADDLSPMPVLVEVVSLSDRAAELRPLDPAQPAKALAGRVFRFVDSVVVLP